MIARLLTVRALGLDSRSYHPQRAPHGNFDPLQFFGIIFRLSHVLLPSSHMSTSNSLASLSLITQLQFIMIEQSGIEQIQVPLDQQDIAQSPGYFIVRPRLKFLCQFELTTLMLSPLCSTFHTTRIISFEFEFLSYQVDQTLATYLDSTNGISTIYRLSHGLITIFF